MKLMKLVIVILAITITSCSTDDYDEIASDSNFGTVDLSLSSGATITTTGKNVNRNGIFGQVAGIQVSAKHIGGYTAVTDFTLVASGAPDGNTFKLDNVMFGQNTISATTTTAVTPDAGTITEVVAPTPQNVTFTVGNEQVNLNAHGFTNGTVVSFPTVTTTTGITANTNYFVVNAAANTFKVSTTSGGTAINLTGSNGSGTVILSDTAIILPYTNKLPYATYTGSSSLNIVAGTTQNPTIAMSTQNSRLILLVDSQIGFTTNVEVLVNGAPTVPAKKFALAANTNQVIYWSDANSLAGKSISFKCDMFGIGTVTTTPETMVANKSMRRKVVLTNNVLTVTATKTIIN
jgi:hypothetical protein